MDDRNKIKVLLVAGARPNFMKIAPIVRALEAKRDIFSYRIVHTGQHFDHEMSDVFFSELGIPTPDHHLNCGGGSHAEQTAKIMLAFEPVCQAERPACVLVVGDVNSTLACSIVAKKLQIPVAHVEAGLRSGDTTMPEEINRLVTDAISDWLYATEPSAIDNLCKEGKSQSQIFHVGHVMIDNLLYQARRLAHADKAEYISETLKSKYVKYGVVTLHRPSNVDDLGVLKEIASALVDISKQLPLIFPVHPRTKRSLDTIGLDLGDNIILTKPLSYMDFLNLWKDAVVVLTDSGGLQEETTGLGVPCLTLRENTERPITVECGSNHLVGTSRANILAAFRALDERRVLGRRPELWDGKAAARIVCSLESVLGR